MTLTFRQGQGLSFHELNRLAAGLQGSYVFPSSAGGAVTPSSGLTVAVAAISANIVKINSVLGAIAYAGGTVTAGAADSTKDRIDTVYYDGTATVAVAPGTAVTTSATVFPVPPTLAAGQIAVANLYVGHGYTSIASGDIDDRRVEIGGGWQLVGFSTTENSTTSAAGDVTLTTVTLSPSVAAAQFFQIRIGWRKTAGFAAIVALGLKINSTLVLSSAGGGGLPVADNTNQAENGLVIIDVMPVATNYDSGLWAVGTANVSGTGGNVTNYPKILTTGAYAAVQPNAARTQIVVTGYSGNAGVTCAVQYVEVWARG